ncbi:unnamed protein product, partial [Polarella glacialis]
MSDGKPCYLQGDATQDRGSEDEVASSSVDCDPEEEGFTVVEDVVPPGSISSTMRNRPKPADLADTPAKVNFLVRNTFIDGIPETPTSPFDFKRQAQSCPGTSLMNHATPLSGTFLGGPSQLRDLFSKLGKEMPSSPPPPNPRGGTSPGLDGATARPWSDDLVKSLVSSAAAAISPMASSATRRGSPGVVSAYSLDRLSAALDPVAMAVASAASAAEAEEATAPPAIQSPCEYGRTPDQRYCATPSPWP